MVHKRDADAASESRYFVRMSKPVSHAVVLFQRKNLRLIGKAPHWGRKQDAVVVTLNLRPVFDGFRWGVRSFAIYAGAPLACQ
jgi:hypothetical protein